MQGNVIVQLSEEDVITVEQILLDQDGELALKLIREKIAPAIKKCQPERCKTWE